MKRLSKTLLSRNDCSTDHIVASPMVNWMVRNRVRRWEALLQRFPKQNRRRKHLLDFPDFLERETSNLRILNEVLIEGLCWPSAA